MQRHVLETHLNDLLHPELFNDYCPNGLQVEGKDAINRIVTGVTACQALIDKAIMLKADAILVHHGYFWKGESPCVVDIKANRLRSLLTQNINLFAYHLPLDAHPELGNNAQLGKLLGLTEIGRFDTGTDPSIGWLGTLDAPTEGEKLAEHIETVLQHKPTYVAGAKHPIQTIAWCTGGAQNYIDAARKTGASAYLTGEISEQTVHSAREGQIDFFAVGHHASERYGIKALGEHLEQQFGLEHFFVDIPSPA